MPDVRGAAPIAVSPPKPALASGNSPGATMATAQPTELARSNTAGKRLGVALAVISAAQLMVVLDGNAELSTSQSAETLGGKPADLVTILGLCLAHGRLAARPLRPAGDGLRSA